jgi:hypothetical protein
MINHLDETFKSPLISRPKLDIDLVVENLVWIRGNEVFIIQSLVSTYSTQHIPSQSKMEHLLLRYDCKKCEVRKIGIS